MWNRAVEHKVVTTGSRAEEDRPSPVSHGRGFSLTGVTAKAASAFGR